MKKTLLVWAVSLVVMGIGISECAAQPPARSASTTTPAKGTSPLPAPGLLDSQRLASGVPLGGLGTGCFQFHTDGAFGEMRWDNRTTDESADIPASFGAIWTRAANHTEVRVLALHPAYGLPGVSTLNFDGLYPKAELTFPEFRQPIAVTLRALSPLIPFDLKSSSFPGALFVYTLRNTTMQPVEASVALSWQMPVPDSRNGSVTRPEPLSPVTVLPAAEGYFGHHFGLSPAGGSEAPAGPEATLLTFPSQAQANVTTTVWSSSAPTPGWWSTFQAEGRVSGENSPPPPGDGDTAVIAVRVTLKPRETVDIPMAICWYLPPPSADSIDGGFYYQTLYPNSQRFARKLLSDWLLLLTLTQEWQNRLLFSNLSPWLPRLFINSAAPLTTHSIHTRDGRIVFRRQHVEDPAAANPAPTASAVRERLATGALLLDFFPSLAPVQIGQMEALQQLDGRLPLQEADWTSLLGPPLPSPNSPPGQTPLVMGPPAAGDIVHSSLEGTALYLLDCGAYTRASGDASFANLHLAGIRRALNVLTGGQPEAPFTQEKATTTSWQTSLRASAIRTGLALIEIANEKSVSCLPPGAAAPTEKAADKATVADRTVPLSVGAAGEELSLDWLIPEQYSYDTPEFSNRLWSYLEAERKAKLLFPWHAHTKTGGKENQDTSDSVTQAADWGLLDLVDGFAWNGVTGSLNLTPPLPGATRSLLAPIYSSTFWARVEFKPTAHGSLVSFRLDRVIALIPAQQAPTNADPARITIARLRVPGPPPRPGQADNPLPIVHISLGPMPLGARIHRESNGDLTLTLDTPLCMAAGDRLEVDSHLESSTP